MAKTKEELIKLKQEVESLATKLKELSEDELKTIAGGVFDGWNVINPEENGIKKNNSSKFIIDYLIVDNDENK